MKTLLKDLNWKFGVLLSIILMTVTMAERGVLMKQARVAMETRLSEKAAFINTFYAFLIADALQRKDDVTLLQVINRLEEDPEILSVVVVDNQGEIRYHADSQKLGTLLADPAVEKAMETGDGVMNSFQNTGGRALMLISPLKVQGMPHPIGAVRIELTYHHILDQMNKFNNSFNLATLGFVSAALGFFMIFIRKWITLPLENIEKTLAGMRLSTAEPQLAETSDEFGRLHKALNNMIIRFRSEMQELSAGAANPGDVEAELVERLFSSFLPKSRLILADKNNRILSVAHNGAPAPSETTHLLDLITDRNFANLVGTAYQQEGEVMKGDVLFENEPCKAVVVCIPDRQSQTIKTVIALETKE